MRYALLICMDESTELSDEERRAREDEFHAYSARLGARGVLQTAERLRPTDTATTVQIRDAEVVIADGPSPKRPLRCEVLFPGERRLGGASLDFMLGVIPRTLVKLRLLSGAQPAVHAHVPEPPPPNHPPWSAVG